MHNALFGGVVVPPKTSIYLIILKYLFKKAIFKKKTTFISTSIAINIYIDNHNIARTVMFALIIYAIVVINKKLLTKFTAEIEMHFKTIDFFKNSEFWGVVVYLIS